MHWRGPGFSPFTGLSSACRRVNSAFCPRVASPPGPTRGIPSGEIFMAIPNPPQRPPAKGNSQQQVVRHESAQQERRPREMHPAVQEAMGRYAAIWEENDELRTENGKLQKENEVLRSLDKEKSDLIAS